MGSRASLNAVGLAKFKVPATSNVVKFRLKFKVAYSENTGSISVQTIALSKADKG
jgi:hypothetical protein